jgi:transposase InsO family protein
METVMKPVQNGRGRRRRWSAEQKLKVLQEARLMIEAWGREYTEKRTHSTIGDVTPQEFIPHYRNRAQRTQKVTSSASV